MSLTLAPPSTFRTAVQNWSQTGTINDIGDHRDHTIKLPSGRLLCRNFRFSRPEFSQILPALLSKHYRQIVPLQLRLLSHLLHDAASDIGDLRSGRASPHKDSHTIESCSSCSFCFDFPGLYFSLVVEIKHLYSFR